MSVHESSNNSRTEITESGPKGRSGGVWGAEGVVGVELFLLAVVMVCANRRLLEVI
jgi:hypothetical protein